MRYAIVSDLHANLAAWQTVLNDIADLKADKIICLGDVVGYGPNPVEVLESVYQVVSVTLQGNHDAAVCGALSPESFSPRAQAAVRQHRELLAPAALEWLKQLPLIHAEPGFRCAHSEFDNPALFRYIIEPADALPSWKVTKEQLLFVGHSHLPGIYVIGASGTPHFVAPCDFELEEGKRYIINPGSVGYPRVGDRRSSYCIFDDRQKAITFRQLPFDSAGYRQAVQGAGLDDDPWLQQKEEQQHLPTLRESRSFAKAPPPAPLSPAPAAPPRPPLLDRFRTPLIVALVGLALSVALAGGMALLSASRDAPPATLAVTVPDFDLPSCAAYPLAPPDKNLLPLLPAALNADGRLDGWRYAFEDRLGQTFSIGLRDSATTLCIRHAGPHKAQLESPLINLAGTHLRALRLRGRIRKGETFSGTVFYQLVTYTSQPDGTPTPYKTESFEVRDTRQKASTPAATLTRKVALSKPITHVRFRVDASFEGTLEIEQPYLGAPVQENKE
jgi:predicted phosphodiesterase